MPKRARACARSRSTRLTAWRRGAVARAAIVGLLSAGCSAPAPPAGPDIVLISIDTLRADRLNGYGYERREVSPSIDRLAEAPESEERALRAIIARSPLVYVAG